MGLIFISHNSCDNSMAAKVVDFLSKLGHRGIFLDFDANYGIPAGRNWEREIYKTLEKCQLIIVLYSNSYASSHWCFAETVFGRSLGKYIITLNIDNSDVINILAETQIINASFDFKEALNRLNRGLETAGITKDNWDETRPPYPGLLAFEEQDGPVFYGRSNEKEDLLKLFRQFRNFGGSKLLMILGASGSGKSSLIRAGVIPHLRRDTTSWIVIGPFRPLKNPFEELSKDIAAVFKKHARENKWSVKNILKRPGSNEDWKFIYARLMDDARSINSKGKIFLGLLNELAMLADSSSSTILVFIDQFEELFADQNDQNGEADNWGTGVNFTDFLRGVLEHPSNNKCLVVGTLRSDFLGQFQEHEALKSVAFDNYMIRAMNKEELKATIVEPARIGGVELEEGLVEKILQDVGTHDALPLLAFTLRELWEQYGKDGRIEKDEYTALGGLGGSVARAAEAVLKDYIVATGGRRVIKAGNENSLILHHEDVKFLKAAFREMVRIDEEGRYTKKPANWEDMPPEIRRLLLRFVTGRLLTRNGDGKNITIEVAHEAIFRTWERLVTWLEEDKSFLKWRKRLAHAMEEWNLSMQNEWALQKGPVLAESIRWLEQVSVGSYHLKPQEAGFISLSNESERKSIEQQRRHLENLVSERTAPLKEAMTELKSTQVQLIQKEKMVGLGELTAAIVHEIQNPLNFVNNFSEINKLLLEELKKEVDKGNVNEIKAIANNAIDNEKKINHHGKRAEAILKGILQECAKNSRQKQPTDINALCDEYLRLSYHSLRAKDKTFNADIRTDFDESIGKIAVAPENMGRVLLNLFNNAFNAVVEKQKDLNGFFEPTVTVTTRKGESHVVISVADNGSGIPSNIIDKIFQPFFTTRQGTGLGLSLVYETITQEYGGELTVISKEGEGAEFVVKFPAP